MTNTVRTQSITNGQIGQIANRLATRLREHDPQQEHVQKVLMMPGNVVIDKMAAVFLRHVQVYKDTVVRRVRVDRTRTPKEVTDATILVSHLDMDVLNTMPQGEGEEVDVYFVPVKRIIPASNVPKFLAQYGLVSDPRAQAAVNEVDPFFANRHPNGTQWGENCRLSFRCWWGQRSVRCDRSGDDWSSGWFLSGVRK